MARSVDQTVLPALSSWPDWVQERATTRAILGALAGFVVIQRIFAGVLVRRFRSTTGERLPDSTIGYSYDEIYAAIDAYGTQGIQIYSIVEVLDLVFRLVSGALVAVRQLTRG